MPSSAANMPTRVTTQGGGDTEEARVRYVLETCGVALDSVKTLVETRKIKTLTSLSRITKRMVEKYPTAATNKISDVDAEAMRRAAIWLSANRKHWPTTLAEWQTTVTEETFDSVVLPDQLGTNK